MTYLGIGPETIAQNIEKVCTTADSSEDKLRASLEIEHLVIALGVIKSGLDKAVYDTFGAGTLKVADRQTGEVRQAKVTTKTTKVIDADGLRSAILARIGDHKAVLFDEAGDLQPPAAIATNAAEMAFRLAGAGTPGYSGWRSTPLKAELGLTVADYTAVEITGAAVKAT